MWRPHVPLTLLLTGLCQAALAEPRCVRTSSEQLSYGDSIELQPVTRGLTEVVRDAIELWSGCRRHVAGVPTLHVGTKGTRRIEVVFIDEPSGSRRCGTFVGSKVVLYRSAFDAEGKPVLCGEVARTLAHEIGHVLGLADQYDPACRRFIMSQVPPREADRRYPTPAECRAVADRWRPLPPIEPS